MNCDRLREVLVEHVDGLLGAGEAEGARSHLSGCVPCRALQDEVRRGFAAFDAWEDEPLPDGAFPRLLARLPRGPSVPFSPPVPGLVPSGRPWVRAVGVAAIPYVAGLATAAVALLYFLPGAATPPGDVVPGAPDRAAVAAAGAGTKAADPGTADPGVASAPLAAASVAGGGNNALRAGEKAVHPHRSVRFRDFDYGVVRTVSLPAGLEPGKVILMDPRVPVVEPAGGVR